MGRNHHIPRTGTYYTVPSDTARYGIWYIVGTVHTECVLRRQQTIVMTEMLLVVSYHTWCVPVHAQVIALRVRHWLILIDTDALPLESYAL